MASITVAEFINRVGFKIDKSSVDKVNGTIRNIKSTATKLLGTIGIGLSLTAVNALVEEFGRVNEQVRNSTAALGDQADIQKKIMEAASAMRSSYAATAGIISDLVHESPNLFGNVDEAVKFSNAATMLFKSAGKTNEEISGLMEAINKSFAKGYVDSETMSQLLEKSPEAVELLNKKLGTTSDKLEELASYRAMTVADLKAAFVDNADAIEKKFGGVQYRITDALTVIRNKWGLWLSQMDTTMGVTDKIARAMVKVSDTVMAGMNKARNAVVWLCDKLGGADKLFRLLAISVGAVFGVRSLATVYKFITGLKNLDVAALKIKLKVAGITAAIILLALLVEDFINFMQGNDSLLGSMLEKAGIDADKVRETIKTAWTKINSFLVGTWNTIKRVCGAVFGGIQEFFDEHGAQIGAALSNAWKAIKDVLTLVWRIIKVVAVSLFESLRFYWEKWGKTILTAFQSVWSVVKTVFKTALDLLIDVFSVFAALFAGDWEGLWENLKKLFTDLWNGILNVLSTNLTALWNVVSSVWSSIWGTISGIAAAIWGSVTTAFTNILNGVKSIVGNIKDSVVEGFTAAIDWIKGLPAQALQWGADIIQGIVDGIKGAVGKVGEAVAGVAGKIKSFIGFSEPETGPLSDFHTYMPDMVDLMTRGINANKGKLTSAMQSLCGDMSIMAQAGIAATPATAAAAIGASSISKTFVQTNNFNQQFSGERAIQQRAAKAMEKAADDVTSELARGLSYLR